MRWLRFGDRWVDPTSGKVVGADGSEQWLTANEARLLRYLGEHPGRYHAKEMLLQDVWGYATGVVSRTIDNTVRRLRLKLEPQADEPRYLRVRYGLGVGLFDVEQQPTEPAPFFGRTAELAALRDHMETPDGPPLVVVGLGGVGKTALVRNAVTAAPVSVVWVDLRTMGLDEALTAALDGAIDIAGTLHLRAPVVLVLDHCDAVATEVVARWAAWQVRGVTVLATARMPLAAGRHLRLTGLPTADAVALLTDRIGRHTVSFAPEPLSLAALAGALDGFPMALELAATALARTRLAEPGPDAFARIGATAMLEEVRERVGRSSSEARAALDASCAFVCPVALGSLVELSGGSWRGVEELVDAGLLVGAGSRWSPLRVVTEATASPTDVARAAHLRWCAERADREPTTWPDGAEFRAAAAWGSTVAPAEAARCALAAAQLEADPRAALQLVGGLSEVTAPLATRFALANLEAQLHLLLGQGALVDRALTNARALVTTNDERWLLATTEALRLAATVGAEETRRWLDTLPAPTTPTARLLRQRSLLSGLPSGDARRVAAEVGEQDAASAGDALSQAHFAWTLAFSDAGSGRYTRAAAALDRARAAADRDPRGAAFRPFLVLATGEFALAQGHLGLAESALTDAAAMARGRGEPPGVWRAHTRLAVCWAWAGRASAATTLLKGLRHEVAAQSPMELLVWIATVEVAWLAAEPELALSALERAHALALQQRRPDVTAILLNHDALANALRGGETPLEDASSPPHQALRLAMHACAAAWRGDTPLHDTLLARVRRLALQMELAPDAAPLRWPSVPRPG